MEYQVVATFDGVGKVFNGGQLVTDNAVYSLKVIQEFITSGGHRIPGMKSIEGTIDGLPMSMEFLTLVTQEGHTMQFWVGDSDGGVRPSGPLLDADKKPVI